MNKIIKEIKKELIKIDGQLKKIDILLESAPDGYLNYKIVNNRVYYYHQLIGRAKKGNGTPLQYSCLENPMDGGAW